MSDQKTDLLVFHNENGDIQSSVDFESETLWASQKQIAELFGVNQPAVSKHITNILNDQELDKTSVYSKMELTAQNGGSYSVEHYNLDMIISVGYRVNNGIKEPLFDILFCHGLSSR